MRAILALLFMLGALVMVVCAALSWLGLIVMAAHETHWSVGALLFGVSFWAGYVYQEILVTPWRLWAQLWYHVDDQLTGSR